LASQLRGFLRTPDILGRYQNDKFIIILPETTSENAKVVAERIIKLSKNSNLTESYKVKTHLKVGVTILDPKNDDSIHTLIEKAYNSYTLARNDKRCHIKVYE
jgi:diguanylate cyclase (GGDEF)-like protein